MKKNINKQKGSTIVVCLVIMIFISVISIINFNSSKNDLRISSNIEGRNIKGAAAETGIKISLEDSFKTSDGINRILQLRTGEIMEYCSDQGLISTENCAQKFLDENKTITSYSETTLNIDNECLAYGNSDKKSYCYTIKGIGNIPVLNGNEAVHIQEVQVNTININNNGIYEL